MFEVEQEAFTACIARSVALDDLAARMTCDRDASVSPGSPAQLTSLPRLVHSRHATKKVEAYVVHVVQIAVDKLSLYGWSRTTAVLLLVANERSQDAPPEDAVKRVGDRGLEGR